MREDCEFILQCNCGCGMLKILGYTEFDDEPDALGTLYYTMVGNSINSFKERLRMAWNLIRGRQYCIYDLVITKRQLQEFKDWVKEL